MSPMRANRSVSTYCVSTTQTQTGNRFAILATKFRSEQAPAPVILPKTDAPSFVQRKKLVPSNRVCEKFDEDRVLSKKFYGKSKLFGKSRDPKKISQKLRQTCQRKRSIEAKQEQIGSTLAAEQVLQQADYDFFGENAEQDYQEFLEEQWQNAFFSYLEKLDYEMAYHY